MSEVIGNLTQVKMKANKDKDSRKVRFQFGIVSERLNLQYEHDYSDKTEEDLNSDCDFEEDVGKESKPSF